MKLQDAIEEAIKRGCKIKRTDQVWHYWFNGRFFTRVTGGDILMLEPENLNAEWELVEDE